MAAVRSRYDTDTMNRTVSRIRLSNRWLWESVGLLVAALLLLVLAPGVLSDFWLNLLAKYLTYAIIAIGLDLLWGYTGLLSLGQGVFFGLGGYAMAMYLKLEASGNSLPDFMTWSGLKKLPWFWAPFRHPLFAVPVTIIGPAILAFLLGYLVFRSRVKGVYFAIITQALALILSIFFVGQQAYTGGTNGLTNYSTMFGQYVIAPGTQHALYLCTVICLVAVYLFSRWITRSRFGRLMIAIRDDENRVRFSGYNVVLIKSIVFAISGAVAGLAGALFVPQVGIISPADFGVVPSIEMTVWVAVGGRGTLLGPALGAVLVGAASSGFSDTFPDIWQFFLGGLFVGSVLLFPQGLVGAVRLGRVRLAAAIAARRLPPRIPVAPIPDSDVGVVARGD